MIANDGWKGEERKEGRFQEGSFYKMTMLTVLEDSYSAYIKMK